MVRKLALAAIIWMLSVSPVWAEDWKLVSTDTQGNNFFLDIDSVRKSGGYVYFWDYVNLITPEDNIQSVKSYKKVDCDSLDYLVLTFEGYEDSHATGRLIVTFNPEKKWHYHSSGSPTRPIAKEACKLDN